MWGRYNLTRFYIVQTRQVCWLNPQPKWTVTQLPKRVHPFNAAEREKDQLLLELVVICHVIQQICLSRWNDIKILLQIWCTSQHLQVDTSTFDVFQPIWNIVLGYLLQLKTSLVDSASTSLDTLQVLFFHQQLFATYSKIIREQIGKDKWSFKIQGVIWTECLCLRSTWMIYALHWLTCFIAIFLSGNITSITIHLTGTPRVTVTSHAPPGAWVFHSTSRSPVNGSWWQCWR